MLVAGTILYCLYDNWRRKTVRVILFVLSLGIYGYFYFTYGHLDVWMDNVKYIGMKTGVLRALAGMSAGILIYESGKWIQRLTEDKRIGRLIYRLECMGYVFISVYSLGLYLGGYTRADFLFLVILVLCVASTFFNTYGNDRRICNNCITEWLGKLTYGIYLNHNLWRGRIFPGFFSVEGYSLWWVVLYLIIVVLYTYVVNKLVWWIVDKSRVKKMRIL